MDPDWSRLVSAVDARGVERTWHVLDTGPKPGAGTVLCVHGNPNWSYMWRGLARELVEWRVIAVDALNMGFSERTGGRRLFADHCADLHAVTQALDVQGPVVTVAHDWGGPISMGWAQRNLDMLAGVVLMNTGVARPHGVKVPPLISIARATLRATCETTPTFLHGALRMARPQLDPAVYRSYTAPYRSAAQRTGVRDFVEDIPIDVNHPSYDALAAVAEGLGDMQDVPSLLLWGAKDIIFSDAFLHDVSGRLPQADVHRYPDAGHQIIEDTDAISVIDRWIAQRINTTEPRRPTASATTPPATTLSATTLSGTATADGPATMSPIWSAIGERSADDNHAIIEMDTKDSSQIERAVSFRELDQRVQLTMHQLAAAGVKAGDRLATLVPPGIDLTVLVYACLRSGIIVIPPDAALGLDGIRRALRSSRPDYLVGDWRGQLLARSLRLPAIRLSLGDLLADRAVAAGPDVPEPIPEPTPGDTAAIVFTSGSTGPSKGVVYTHGQLQAQRDAVRAAFRVEPTDKLVVAFAPFAVLAPALGIPSVVPPMDVTKPAELTARTLANAACAIDATIVFASPAVLANIAATAGELDTAGRASLASVRAVATAGAPVSPALLAAAEPVFPNAQFFTPYGMTELMPVTMASADEISAGARAANGENSGVCVGQPLPMVQVAIRPIDAPTGSVPEAVGPGELGEVWARAEHGSTTYDQLWRQSHNAFVNGWHRSGDVGHLDAQGRLWIEGRVDHLISTSNGVLAPVGIELAAEAVVGVDRAVAVGVGPVGAQQLVVVVGAQPARSHVVADTALTSAVRQAVTTQVAAVLVAPKIPVDRRHNSKVDRSRVQRWADAVLRGDRPPRL